MINQGVHSRMKQNFACVQCKQSGETIGRETRVQMNMYTVRWNLIARMYLINIFINIYVIL